MAEQGGQQGPQSDSTPPVSITVTFFPCYNEQANVGKVAEQAVKVLEALGADYEIIIVDDGSADETGRIADGIAAANERVRAIHHPHNLGYGAALQSGFSRRGPRSWCSTRTATPNSTSARCLRYYLRWNSTISSVGIE